MQQILICRAGTPPQSLPQAAKLPVQGKVDFPENACIVPGKTDEVVLPGESTKIINTAGGTTSSDLATLGHLPLNRSLRSLGKAFGRGSSYSCSLFPRLPDKSEFTSPPVHKTPEAKLPGLILSQLTAAWRCSSCPERCCPGRSGWPGGSGRTSRPLGGTGRS